LTLKNYDYLNGNPVLYPHLERFYTVCISWTWCRQ